MSMTAEDLGKIVRMVWVDYCKQTNTLLKPVPYDESSKWDRELVKRIRVEIYNKTSVEYHEEILALQEKLFRAEQALGLLDAIIPEKVKLAKEIAAGFDPDSTLGGHCLQLADGIDKIREGVNYASKKS